MTLIYHWKKIDWLNAAAEAQFQSLLKVKLHLESNAASAKK